MVQKIALIEAKDYIPSFVQRRSNFQGIKLKAITDFDVPAVGFPDDFKSTAKYFPNNETYEMTNLVYGIYIDVLHSMEKTLNFSTSLYRRKDGSWGTPKPFPNGTVVLKGMMKTVNEGSVDFIWTSLSILLSRWPYVGNVYHNGKRLKVDFAPNNGTLANNLYSGLNFRLHKDQPGLSVLYCVFNSGFSKKIFLMIF